MSILLHNYSKKLFLKLGSENKYQMQKFLTSCRIIPVKIISDKELLTFLFNLKFQQSLNPYQIFICNSDTSIYDLDLFLQRYQQYNLMGDFCLLNIDDVEFSVFIQLKQHLYQLNSHLLKLASEGSKQKGILFLVYRMKHAHLADI